MRLLLLSDTHGNLECINDVASRARADLVVHAGDFGFYDNESFDRLSDRELRLQVVHSHLPQEEKVRISKLPQPGVIEAAREHRLLGSFQDFLDGIQSFAVPVYAVWGNHEDKAVIERLYRDGIQVTNLHILHDQQAHCVGPVFLYGLGGNLLPGAKMLREPVAGGRGKIWSTLTQYAELVATAERHAGYGDVRIFVSHVSPGKEAFVEYLAARTGATYTVSGHMGAPTCMIWNSFATSTVEEAETRLEAGFAAIEQACAGASRKCMTDVESALNTLRTMPDYSMIEKKKSGEPAWYRGMTHINLPDAEIGYAILDIDAAGAHLQTCITQTPGR